MAKLIKKKDCQFDHGYIVRKDKIVGIPWVVYKQLNKLELMIQQWEYLKTQKPYCAGPSLDNFKRRSAFDYDRPYIEPPETPTIDRRVDEAMEFMAEVDATSLVAKTNDAIDDFGVLVDWCSAKKFVEGDCTQRIDLVELGNPLDLSAEDIATILKIMVHSSVTFED